MDFASGGSLFSYVQSRNRLREPLARFVLLAAQWTAAQAFMWSGLCCLSAWLQVVLPAADSRSRLLPQKGVANRDIKLENTLLQVQIRHSAQHALLFNLNKLVIQLAPALYSKRICIVMIGICPVMLLTDEAMHLLICIVIVSICLLQNSALHLRQH